jgi:hypothetical protein
VSAMATGAIRPEQDGSVSVDPNKAPGHF